jgi:two-component system chemotaxis sensor kinase CheA
MDANEYLPMFLAESQEHLQALNLAVVRIEETPDDRETIDEIFRAAHSMKGMSATMGFTGIAAVTHEMEDVFELLKHRAGGLGREAVDVLLECLDAISGAVDSIDTDGTENIEPAPLIARLRGLVRGADASEPDPTPGAVAATLAAAADLPEGLGPVAHVRVELTEDCAIPSVRAYMVLNALQDCGELVKAVPDAQGVEEFSGRVIDAWLADPKDVEVVRAALGSVSEVARVEVDAPSEPLDPEPEPVEAAAPAAAPADLAEPDAADAARPAGGGSPAKKKGAATVRVDAERLDSLMHQMGELVVQRTLVESLVGQAKVPGLSEAMGDLTRISQSLQAMVMQVRMIPVEAVFMRFPRLVRDLSQKLGKQVDLDLVGKETELDRTVVDMLGDPLVHLVRNALDHGLEGPEERQAAGKPPGGRLEISARHAGGNVVIGVTDDGRGIDPQAVARKAVERGLITPEQADGIDVARAAELLFHPGFSTKEETSDISGRGVGMDAVRTTVRELGGDVVLTSEPGRGSTATIRLPLTLAIVNALLVEAGDRPFAVPLDRVETTLALADHPVRSVAGRRMLVLRDGVLPLVDAAAALEHVAGTGQDFAVVVRSGEDRMALAVQHLVGQRELVTRPLPAEASTRAAVSAGAVLSDGRIALIVDCDALAATSGATLVTA